MISTVISLLLDNYLIVVAVLVIGLIGYYFQNRRDNRKVISTFKWNDDSHGGELVGIALKHQGVEYEIIFKNKPKFEKKDAFLPYVVVIYPLF